jgi:anti-sigma B factor antagonist
MPERHSIEPVGPASEVTVVDGSALIVLDGDIDLANTDDIERSVDEILALHPVTSVVLDLARVDFLDSTGLRMLWSVRQKAQDADAKLIIRTPSDAVMRLLRLTGMHRIFQIEDVA